MIIGFQCKYLENMFLDEYLKKPYPANFNRIPAKIIDPAKLASTWASGNQIWNGIIGTFTAKDKKNKDISFINTFLLAVLVDIWWRKLKNQ